MALAQSFEEWNPNAYRGAGEEFHHARVRECCTLLGRAFFRKDPTALLSGDALPYAPAIAQMLMTILCSGGISTGAFAMLLKDAILAAAMGQREAGAMMLGVSDRLLDPFFGLLRNWGSEPLVRTVFGGLARLSSQVLDPAQQPD